MAGLTVSASASLTTMLIGAIKTKEKKKRQLIVFKS